MRPILIALALCGACFADIPCVVNEVAGTYAFLANGSVLVPGAPISGPFMRIGYFTADGKGGLHFSTLALYNGINFGVENFTGTYTVSSDCSFSTHAAVPQPVNAGADFKGQIALGGTDVTFMLTNVDDPTKPALSTVTGFGKARSIFNCSNLSLLGAWRMEINGFNNLPPATNSSPFRQVGRFTYDGRGGLLASFITSSNNGVISSDTGAGTYTVNSDCTFDLSYKIGATPYGIRGSMIAFDNAFISLNMPGVNVPGVGLLTGAVATGTLAREPAFRLSDLFAPR